VSPRPSSRPADDAIPPLLPGTCQVWWADPSAAGSRLLDLLDDAERARHDAFLREADRDRFLAAHALARILAAAAVGSTARSISYAAAPAGVTAAGLKPRFTGAAAGLELSISHAARRVVVALCASVPVGVDVESIGGSPVDRSLVDAVLADGELAEFGALPQAAQAPALCRYWTRKEAVLKASGDGLSVSPARIAVSGPTTAPALVDWAGPGRPARAVYLRDLDAGPGYTAALASIGAPLEPSEHDAGALLGAWA
jgi:4'-phosphopantetheinyl transferase